MINFVKQALEEDEDFKHLVQEQYHYFLIDEYQDTNNAQNQLIFLLADYWGEQANIFVVGDDDQSIFRFPGASVENILSFADRVCYEKKCYERGCEQINRGTEPLSFCLLNDDSEKLNNGELYIGDLIISLEVLCEEASNLEIEFNDYLARILVHGIAHLLGFSHKNRVFEEQMIKFESNMLCQIGLKNIAEIL